MTGETRPLEWSSADFLRNGEAVMRALAAYHDTLREPPVASFEGVDTLAASLSQRPPPQLPEAFDEILADTLSEVVPNLVHWNHPRFHGYFSIWGSYPGALADLLTAGLNVNAMLWSSAPAAALVGAGDVAAGRLARRRGTEHSAVALLEEPAGRVRASTPASRRCCA